jgi:enoyl-[acyl-carrier protein] reductase III
VSHDNEARWAVILGASSGFGEAAARTFAAAGWDIFGVHLDRRAGLEHVEEIKAAIAAHGRQAHFFNANAADADKRRELVGEMTAPGRRPPRRRADALARLRYA